MSTIIISMWFLVVFYFVFPLFIYNKKWAWLRSPITKKRKKIPYKSFTVDRLNKYDDVDVIIVGSNISALICAALLSRVNIKVLVLEKETSPGGTFKTNKRGGVEYETDFKYLKDLDCIYTVLNTLVSKKVWWHKLKEPILEVKNSKTLKLMNSRRETKNSMRYNFSNETAQDKLWRHVEKYKNSRKGVFVALKVYHMPQYFRETLQEIICPTYLSYNKMSLLELFADCGFKEEDKLTDILSSMVEPGASAGVLLDNLTITEAFYPKFGPRHIIDELCHEIRTRGSVILTEAEVNAIKPVAHTVTINGKHEVSASKIVSAVSLYQTFKLVGREPPKLTQKTGKLYAFISIKDEEHELPSDKIIIQDNKKYYISSLTKKQNVTDAKGITVSVEADEEPEDKEKTTDEFLKIAGFENRDKIEYVNIEFRHCERMVNDGKKMFRACKPYTQYRNLFLTGKDMMHTDTLDAAIKSGYITANAVTNYGTFFDVITGNELIKNI